MKVYMVTSGEYSDYGVCGIFSTKEKAEKYIKFMLRDSEHRWNEFNDIEEIELDSYEELINSNDNIYHGYMNEEGNQIRDITINNDMFELANSFAIGNDERYGGLFMHYYVRADSPEKAVKIANDKRAQIISNNNFVNRYMEGKWCR